MLARNLLRLRAELAESEVPTIAILGQPGAGKSALLYGISSGKARPIPRSGVQTDTTSWAKNDRARLLSRWARRLVADCPGHNTKDHPTATFVRHFPFHRFDVLLFVLKGKIHAADVVLMKKARAAKSARMIIVRCYAEDLVPGDRTLVLADIQKHLKPRRDARVVFVSSVTGEGIEELRDVLSQPFPPAKRRSRRSRSKTSN